MERKTRRKAETKKGGRDGEKLERKNIIRHVRINLEHDGIF